MSSILYPSITQLPSTGGVGQSERLPRREEGVKGEFDKLLGNELESIKAPLKFSAHASQRLQDRKIKLDPAMMNKVNDAIDKASAKGVEDTLIITPDAALIVSVKNRTVITALDRNSLNGNVFTNIDGAVIV